MKIIQINGVIISFSKTLIFILGRDTFHVCIVLNDECRFLSNINYSTALPQ